MKDFLVDFLADQINQIIKNLMGPNTNSTSRNQQNVPAVTELKQHETRNKIRERLPLRLSLIGGMIDAVIRNQQTMTLISKMLIQLIASGLVAVDTGDTHDDDLFYTTFDMLAVILWNCLGGDAPELYTSFIKQKDYQSLMKYMKKEVQERNSNSIASLKMLAPLPRVFTSIVTYEPKSIMYDENRKEAWLNPQILSRSKNRLKNAKNGKNYVSSTGDEFSLQFSGVKVLNPWEIIEAVKPLASLNLAWFGARQVEMQPDFWESQQRIVKAYYQHNGKRDLSYYLDEPDIQQLMKEEGFDSVDVKKEVDLQSQNSGNRQIQNQQKPGQSSGQNNGQNNGHNNGQTNGHSSGQSGWQNRNNGQNQNNSQSIVQNSQNPNSGHNNPNNAQTNQNTGTYNQTSNNGHQNPQNPQNPQNTQNPQNSQNNPQSNRSQPGQQQRAPSQPSSYTSQNPSTAPGYSYGSEAYRQAQWQQQRMHQAQLAARQQQQQQYQMQQQQQQQAHYGMNAGNTLRQYADNRSRPNSQPGPNPGGQSGQNQGNNQGQGQNNQNQTNSQAGTSQGNNQSQNHNNQAHNQPPNQPTRPPSYPNHQVAGKPNQPNAGQNTNPANQNRNNSSNYQQGNNNQYQGNTQNNYQAGGNNTQFRGNQYQQGANNAQNGQNTQNNQNQQPLGHNQQAGGGGPTAQHPQGAAQPQNNNNSNNSNSQNHSQYRPSIPQQGYNQQYPSYGNQQYYPRQ